MTKKACQNRQHLEKVPHQNRIIFQRPRLWNAHTAISDVKITKLYEEASTGKRGKKPATPNLALWTGLMDNPITSKGLQEIFQAINCPAPSTTGLQHNVNKVGPMMVQMVYRGPEKWGTLLRVAVIQGIHQYLSRVTAGTTIPCTGPGIGTPSSQQHKRNTPSLKM